MIEEGMIGVNLIRVGFKSTHRTHNTFLKLGVLKREIVFANKNSLCGG